MQAEVAALFDAIPYITWFRDRVSTYQLIKFWRTRLQSQLEVSTRDQSSIEGDSLLPRDSVSQSL
jgi:hypothetical protein